MQPMTEDEVKALIKKHGNDSDGCLAWAAIILIILFGIPWVRNLQERVGMLEQQVIALQGASK